MKNAPAETGDGGIRSLESEQSALYDAAGKHAQRKQDDDHHQHVWFLVHELFRIDRKSVV